MSESARIGIVIPVHNTGQYLDDCMISVIAQTIPTQVVLVDDASSDAMTLDLLQKWETRGVHVVRHNENRGLSAARNTGIRHLTTEYIMPVDSDDIVEPNLASTVVDVLDRYPAVGVVAFDIAFFGAQQFVKHISGTPNGVRDLLFENALPATSAFRYRDWEAVGGYAPEIRWAEDWEFWVRIVSLGRDVHVVHEPLYRYRTHEAQMTYTTSKLDKRESQLAIVARNRNVWEREIEFIMAEYWQEAQLLNSYKRRYGWVNDVLSATLGFGRSVNNSIRSISTRRRGRSAR